MSFPLFHLALGYSIAALTRLLLLTELPSLVFLFKVGNAKVNIFAAI